MADRITAPVSVIIPFFNGQPFIQRAVSSICGQTLRPAEIIVVDDGSDIPIVPTELECDVALRIIRHGVNRGIAAARNTGSAVAEQPWLAFLDQDDEWLPQKLELQMQSVEREGREAARTVFYGRALRIDESGRTLVWPRLSTILSCDSSAWRALQLLITSGNAIPFITVMFSKDAWSGVGRFDEELRGGSDDYAILLTLAARGWSFRAASVSVPIARRHETGFNHSNYERFLSDDVMLLGKLSTAHPDTRQLVRHGIAAAHYRAGLGLLDTDIALSRRHLRTALVIKPLSPRALAAAAIAHSPRALRRVMNSAWSGFRSILYSSGRGRHSA